LKLFHLDVKTATNLATLPQSWVLACVATSHSSETRAGNALFDVGRLTETKRYNTGTRKSTLEDTP